MVEFKLDYSRKRSHTVIRPDLYFSEPILLTLDVY